MTWLSLLSALRKVPPLAWLLAVCVLALAASVYSIGAYGDAREQRGFERATRSAAFDSALVATFSRRREAEQAKTDTVIRYVRAAARDTKQAIANLPDSIRALPAVAPVVIACTTLQERADSLLQQIDTERAAHRMERDVLAAQLRSAAVVIAVQQDSIRALEKRPTRGTLVKVAGVAAGIGMFAEPVVKLLVGVLR